MTTLNIGNFCRAQILAGKSNKEVLELVLAKYNSKTTMACVAWYKSDMRKKGLIEAGSGKQKAMTKDELLAALAAMEPTVAE